MVVLTVTIGGCPDRSDGSGWGAQRVEVEALGLGVWSRITSVLHLKRVTTM